MNWWQILIAVWVGSVPISFYVRTQNTSEIRMGSFLLMWILGPLFTVCEIADLQTIVWKRK